MGGYGWLRLGVVNLEKEGVKLATNFVAVLLVRKVGRDGDFKE